MIVKINEQNNYCIKTDYAEIICSSQKPIIEA